MNLEQGSNANIEQAILAIAASPFLATPKPSLLGLASITSNITTTSASYVDATGLTVTVTVPTGGQQVKISVDAPRWANGTGSVGMYAQLLCDGVQIQEYILTSGGANFAMPFSWGVTHLPSAGVHTYKIQYRRDSSGTLTIYAGGTTPAQLLVESL